MGVVDAAEGAKLLLPPGQLDTEIYTVLGGTSEGVDIMQRAALGEQGLPDIAFRKTHVAAYYDYEQNLVVLNEAYRDLPPEFSAPTLAHELSHRIRRWYSGSMAEEVFARQTQARVWTELQGGASWADVPDDAMWLVRDHDITLDLVTQGDNALIQYLRTIDEYTDLPLRGRDVSPYYPQKFDEVGR